ncbi:hypothetical protein RI845_17850 [Thalassotalea nanhaiensis]|uniref:Uncharacterized protein n=1 Tax=Thalassotalea nanhaiensis TaxID=3065648 RepID=A0ABY9THR3_9GAMM|nr:hypothetical protein RI845_17850 [Colwelliaceae bacterium SQ345]
MSVFQIAILLVIALVVATFFFSTLKKGESPPPKKETWKCFFVGLAIAAPVTVAFYNLQIVPIVMWFLLYAGGFIPWWSKYKKAFAYQWGMFFGITVGLIFIYEGPLQLV